MTHFSEDQRTLLTVIDGERRSAPLGSRADRAPLRVLEGGLADVALEAVQDEDAEVVTTAVDEESDEDVRLLQAEVNSRLHERAQQQWLALVGGILNSYLVREHEEPVIEQMRGGFRFTRSVTVGPVPVEGYKGGGAELMTLQHVTVEGGIDDGKKDAVSYIVDLLNRDPTNQTARETLIKLTGSLGIVVQSDLWADKRGKLHAEPREIEYPIERPVEPHGMVGKYAKYIGGVLHDYKRVRSFLPEPVQSAS